MGRVQKIERLCNFIYSNAIIIFGVSIISVLFVINMISTCYVSLDANEVVFFCRDNILLNIGFLFACLIILAVLKRRNLFGQIDNLFTDENKYKKTKLIMFAIICLLGICWVLFTGYIPGSDQADVLSSAYKIRVGETDMVEPGGYLDRWINQIGITMFAYCLSFIWGDYNVTAFQLLNVAGIVLIYKTFVDIMDIQGVKRTVQIATLLCGIIFVPFIMYSTFVYGTIWSVTFAIRAFYKELCFLREYRIRDMILCAIYMLFGIWVKNNVFIVLIALIIYAIVYSLRDNNSLLKGLALLAIVGLTVFWGCKIPFLFIHSTTGVVLNEGVSSWAYIAMGLQDSDSAPGWYNGYNVDSYEENDCTSLGQAVQAREEIATQINKLTSDKEYAASFFIKKIASMWSEPTYQSFWVNVIRRHRIEFSTWLEMFMSVHGYMAASKFFGVFQIIIIVGNILWLILEDRDGLIDKSFFMMCFIGGFLFHLFWEAKAQYALTYFVMLIPYGIMGYDCLLNKSIKLNSKIIVTIIAMIGFAFIYKTFGNGCLTNETEYYENYVEHWEAFDSTETIWDIAIMRNSKQWNEDYIEYLKRILNDSNISY